MAIQKHMPLRIDDTVDANRLLSGRNDLAGLVRIEATLAQARYNHVVMTLLAQPLQVGFGRNAGVHHHDSPRRSRQAIEHLLERGRLAGIAGKHLAAAYEAAAVQYKGQRHERAVAAALLAAPPGGLAHAGGHPFEVRVGKVVQGHGLAETEAGLRLGKQVLLQILAMLEQRVRGPVQAAQGHRLEVVSHQLTQARAPLQPAVRRQFAAWPRHAADDVAHGGCNLGSVQSQRGQPVLKAALAHRPQRSLFHADAARPQELHAVQIDILKP